VRRMRTSADGGRAVGRHHGLGANRLASPDPMAKPSSKIKTLRIGELQNIQKIKLRRDGVRLGRAAAFAFA